MKYAVPLAEYAHPLGLVEPVTTHGMVLPAAAAAVRHAASVSIHTEPAGHSLLPAAPETYAPAHRVEWTFQQPSLKYRCGL